jgi:NAD-dependent dihydropyrimidine dehydrogenase PreA subunit
MKRKIIEIDENLCNGCGNCITGCAEGALQLVGGKAKLIRDDFCDGLGACIGECPVGALKIIERNAPDFDQAAVDLHLAGSTGGKPHTHHQSQKAPSTPQPSASFAPHPHHHQGGGCPGSRMRADLKQTTSSSAPVIHSDGLPAKVLTPELNQWPVQLHLVSPQAPYLSGRELVLLSTCSPIASADVHWRFIRGRSVVVACPKLDNTAPYAAKLADILASNDIPRLIVVTMEVPCCRGLNMIVNEAIGMLSSERRKKLELEECVVSLDGAIAGSRTVKF